MSKVYLVYFYFFGSGFASLGTLIRYIENQEKHHQKISFKDELLELLKKYDVDYDERYLWD